jgi:two-component system LytT family response regulator
MNPEKISVLIVDDEPEARDLLRMLVSGMDHVTVAGEAEDTDKAFSMVVNTNPDLVFLDIQMPGKNGFDLVGELRAHGYKTGYIFVTAYDEYAIQAVRASAFDYLLKPVDPDELARAINRYRRIRRDRRMDEITDELLAHVEKGTRLKLNTRKGFMLINPGEIVCCMADGNYTRIILSDGREETVSSNLGKIFTGLKGGRYFRISRSGVINLDYLTYVDHKAGTCRLKGASGIDLKVARNRLAELDRIFG